MSFALGFTSGQPSTTWFFWKLLQIGIILMIEISKIKYDGTQSRVEINETTVQEYADLIAAGVDFPPVIVFFDGVDYWLADGFHRFLAHVRAGKDSIFETIIPGGKREAILYSVGANHSHGLRRTNADKRKSVGMLLADREWSAWSDNEIAKNCHVSVSFVGDIRRSRSANNSDKHPEDRTYTTKHGTQSTMNTANIGKKETGRTVADVIRSLDEPEKKHDEIPEEFRMPVLTREQELEQQVRELADCLDDAVKALSDMQNEGTENYVSELAKLRREVEALTISRDSLMFENSELKKHIKYLDKKLAKK